MTSKLIKIDIDRAMDQESVIITLESVNDYESVEQPGNETESDRDSDDSQ